MNCDIIFISYDEEEADRNYRDLLTNYSHAKRVQGVKGIRKAHEKAAKLASSDFFFTIDGDNRFIENKKLIVPDNLIENSVYVWRCKNPVNELIYGYGGVKLWDKSIFERDFHSHGDHAMNATENYIIVHDIVTETHFNTSAFSSWRSAFREAIKLSHNVKTRQDEISQKRLASWYNIIPGAGFKHEILKGLEDEENHYSIHKEESLKLINDFDELYKLFKG